MAWGRCLGEGVGGGQAWHNHLHTHPNPHSEFFATEPRLLRAAVAAFLDLLNLSTRTIEEFGHVPATFA